MRVLSYGGYAITVRFMKFMVGFLFLKTYMIDDYPYMVILPLIGFWGFSKVG